MPGLLFDIVEMHMKRRKKRSALDQIVLGAAKQIRKQRLEFEREASKALSEALGFLVVVKIMKQPRPAQDPHLTLDMRRAARKPKSEVQALILEQLAPIVEASMGAASGAAPAGTKAPTPEPLSQRTPRGRARA
jgi:hypothetical protein